MVSLTDNAAIGILILVQLIYVVYMSMKWNFLIIFVIKNNNNSFNAGLNMIVL